jgi:hypothetical protein
MEVDSVKQRQTREDSQWLRNIGIAIAVLTILSILFVSVFLTTPLLIGDRTDLQNTLLWFVSTIGTPLGGIAMLLLLFVGLRRRTEALKRNPGAKYPIAMFIVGAVGALIYLLLAVMLYINSQMVF